MVNASERGFETFPVFAGGEIGVLIRGFLHWAEEISPTLRLRVSAGECAENRTARSRLRLGATRRSPLQVSIRGDLLSIRGCFPNTAEDCHGYNSFFSDFRPLPIRFRGGLGQIGRAHV